MRRLLLAASLCCVATFWNRTAHAQAPKPIRAPFFKGATLPTPPQQNAPWLHADDALSNAAALLFDQGLADPRGLEYREIEVAVGEPWHGGGYAVKTHGWVLPVQDKSGSFAIAWNGLIYPAVSVGSVADLHQDWASAFAPPKKDRWIREDPSEGATLSPTSPSYIAVALLLRLGEKNTVKTVFTTLPKDQTQPNQPDDPYLMMARDWTWFAFERAVCAHERGDDHLALNDARLLTKVQPLIEAEAKQRGFKLPPDNSDSRYSNRTLPYLSFLQQLPLLLSDSERRVAHPQNAPHDKALATTNVAALLDDLQNVDARQWSQPGGVSLALDPRVQAVVKCGNKAVELLLAVMENDHRLTRSVSFGRDFFRGRNLISVSSAAYAALVDILQVDFKSYDKNDKPLSQQEFIAQIRAYWNKVKDLPPIERLYATLKDDKADPKQWLAAAATISQTTNVESHGGWTVTTPLKPGQTANLRGESLRDGRTPSASQLLAQRSDDIAAIRTGSTEDHFLYIDAGEMALSLAKWDKQAAIPVLKRRLDRAWSIGARPDDILAFNGNPVERFGSIIAQMTIARARCGDIVAYDEYAAWIQKADLKGVYSGVDDLQKPLVQGATRPSIGRAIGYLFNDPKSPWSNVLAEGSGFWFSDFWQSPLPMTMGFRKQASRALMSKTLAGTITFNPRKDWSSRTEAQIEIKGVIGMGFSGSHNDPATPPPGRKLSFRACDVYAYFYSQYQHGPKIQLFWPEAKRDAAVAACRRWLEAPQSKK